MTDGPETTTPELGTQDASWRTYEAHATIWSAVWRHRIGIDLTQEQFDQEYECRRQRDAQALHDDREERKNDYLRQLPWLTDGGLQTITAMADRNSVPPLEVIRLARQCLPHVAPTIVNPEALLKSKVAKWTEADLKVSKKYEEIGS